MENTCFIHLIPAIIAAVVMNGVIGTSVRLSNDLTKAENRPKDCEVISDFQSIQVQADIPKVLNDQPAWLPIKRVNLDGWYWTSLEFYGNQISTKEWHAPGMDCAVLRSLDKIIDDVYCNRIYGFYICQGLRRCDSASYGCLNISGNTYNVYNQSGTWYEASDRCHHRHGQSLAAFGNDNLQLVLQRIAQHFQKWANIWIGLVRSTFQITTSNKEHVNIYKWDQEQPSNLENSSCVVAVRKDARFVWRSQNCNATHRHLCKAEKPVSKTTAGPCVTGIKYIIYSTSLPSSSERIWQILFWVAAFGMLILVAVLLWLCLRIKIRRHKEPTNKEWGTAMEMKGLVEEDRTTAKDVSHEPNPVGSNVASNISNVTKVENILDSEGNHENKTTGTEHNSADREAADKMKTAAVPQQGEDVSQDEMPPTLEIKVNVYYDSSSLTTVRTVEAYFGPVVSLGPILRSSTQAVLQLWKHNHGQPSIFKLKSEMGDAIFYESDIRSIELRKNGNKMVRVTNVTTKTEENSGNQEKPFDIIFKDTKSCADFLEMVAGAQNSEQHEQENLSSKNNDTAQPKEVTPPQISIEGRGLNIVPEKSVVCFQSKVKCLKAGTHNTKEEQLDLKIVEGHEGSARVVLKSLSSAEIICEEDVRDLRKLEQKDCMVSWNLKEDSEKIFKVLFEDQAKLFISLIKDLQKGDDIKMGLCPDHFKKRV